jgi:SGNH domain (fused to AT3 domains)
MLGLGAAVGGATPSHPTVTRVHAAVDAARRHDPVPDALHPALDRLHHDVVDVGRCNYSTGVRRLCRRGAVHAHRTLVVLGDSHARALIPAFEPIARRTGYAAYYLAKSGCTAASVTPDHGAGGFAGCIGWRAWAVGEIRRLRPDVLVITSALPDGLAAPDGRRVTQPDRVAARVRVGLTATIRSVRGSVGRVVVVSDPPGLAEDPSVCLSGEDVDLGSCASPPSDAARLHFIADRAAARASRVGFVDARPWFCWERVCPAVVGAAVTYRDGGHLTTVYARSLADPLRHALGLRPMRR